MDTQLVKNLANLARLDVPETELENVANDMHKILDFIDEIQSVEIPDILSTENKINVFREDVIAPINQAHDLVEASAMHQDHFVKVPKVL